MKRVISSRLSDASFDCRGTRKSATPPNNRRRRRATIIPARPRSPARGPKRHLRNTMTLESTRTQLFGVSSQREKSPRGEEARAAGARAQRGNQARGRGRFTEPRAGGSTGFLSKLGATVLQPAHRGGLCRLGEALYLLPRQAPPHGDGRARDQRFPLLPRGQGSRLGLDAESGALGSALPLPPCPREVVAEARDRRTSEEAQALAGSANSRRSAARPRTDERNKPRHRYAALRRRDAPVGVPAPAR